HRLYRCADSWVAVAALAPGEAVALAGIAGEAGDGGAGRAAWFAARAGEEALTQLRAAGVHCESVMEAQGAFFHDDADYAAAGLHTRYQHSGYGQLEQVGAFWDFDDLPLTLDRPPPALGEHSRAVWHRLGLTADEIE